MNGVIEIKKLRVHAFIGISQQEKTVGNDFEVSIKISYPMSRALINDDLWGTIDYSGIVKIAQEVMSEKCNLIEHAAFNIMKQLQDSYPLIQAGEITVAKLQPPVSAELAEASVTIVF